MVGVTLACPDAETPSLSRSIGSPLLEVVPGRLPCVTGFGPLSLVHAFFHLSTDLRVESQRAQG